MLVERTAGKVTRWFVVFSETVPSPAFRYLIPGKFKHVMAFGYSPEARTWLFSDPAYTGAEYALVPDHLASMVIARFVGNGTVIRIDAKPFLGPNLRIISCCTSTIRHTLGLSGWGLLSLIPDQLYRDCLRAGGVEIPRCVESVEAPPDYAPACADRGWLDGWRWRRRRQQQQQHSVVSVCPDDGAECQAAKRAPDF